MAYDIGLIPGDGIGPEVIDAVSPLVDEIAASFDAPLETRSYTWGSERYIETGAMMPTDALDRLKTHDAILLGAVGHPDVPDHITLHGLLLPIRKTFDQVVCKRPSYLFDGIESPLRDVSGGDIDFVVFRENTEGEYADIGGQEHPGHPHELAIQTAVFTRKATETIVREAFETARERDGHLTSVTKSNAQAHGMVFWDRIVEEISAEYPDIEVERLLVDAASMDLIRRPEDFDVIVASNLFGDVLTDIGAIISGSMGMAPSANIDPTGTWPAMFEPVHGSAPDIAGEGVANPLATVLSLSMLYEWLDEQTAADALWDAVAAQLADHDAPRTPDLGGNAHTDAVVADLVDRI